MGGPQQEGCQELALRCWGWSRAAGRVCWGWHGAAANGAGAMGPPQNPLPTLHPSCPPGLIQPVKGWGGFPSPSTPKSSPLSPCTGGRGWPQGLREAAGTPARRLPWAWGSFWDVELPSPAPLAFPGQLKVSEGATKSGRKLQISLAFLRNCSGCLLGSACGYAAPFSAARGCFFPVPFFISFFLFLITTLGGSFTPLCASLPVREPPGSPTWLRAPHQLLAERGFWHPRILGWGGPGAARGFSGGTELGCWARRSRRAERALSGCGTVGIRPWVCLGGFGVSPCVLSLLLAEPWPCCVPQFPLSWRRRCGVIWCLSPCKAGLAFQLA